MTSVTESAKGLPSALYHCLQVDLADYWDARKGVPPPESDWTRVAAYQMLGSFYKKYVDVTHPEADTRALNLFRSVNQRCQEWSLPPLQTWEEELVGEVRSSLYDFFYPKGMPLLTSLTQFLSEGRVGPGASLGARGYDFYTKLFSSPVTVTSSFLYDEYKRYVDNYPEWSQAEKLREATYGSARIVDGNRLSFVPKNREISRCICVEPSLNMFYQLGVKQILERRLADAFGIDLRVQQGKNRELARLGSYDDVDGFVTIDLSSASDSMSLGALRYLLPAQVMCWFELLRSRRMALPSGEQLELGMISTMGNGFTFPLQTILFASFVIASARVYRRPLRRPYGGTLGDFGVNGDDIICRKSICRGVLRLLELFGFTVNSDKTFVEGPFRESCGHDYFSGHFVRGIYVKTLEHMSSRYALLNALTLWSSRTGIPLPLTYQLLRSTVKYNPVPLWENEDAGIRVPWAEARQRTGRCRTNGTIKYQSYKPVLPKIEISDSWICVPRGQRERIYNPSGLLVAILQGSVAGFRGPVKGHGRWRVGGTIGIRLDTSRYRYKASLTPSWEYSEVSSDIASEERGMLWESMHQANSGRETA